MELDTVVDDRPEWVGDWLSVQQYHEWKTLFHSWLKDVLYADKGASASMISNEKAAQIHRVFTDWDSIAPTDRRDILGQNCHGWRKKFVQHHINGVNWLTHEYNGSQVMVRLCSCSSLLHSVCFALLSVCLYKFSLICALWFVLYLFLRSVRFALYWRFPS